MKRQKTEDDFALLTATQNASSLEIAHVLALGSREMSVGLEAAVAALEMRTAWEETAALRAGAQYILLSASREETALVIKRTCETHEQRHELALEAMSVACEAGAKSAEQRAERSVELMTANVRAVLEDGKSQGAVRFPEFQSDELKKRARGG